MFHKTVGKQKQKNSRHVKDVLFDPVCNLGCLLCACQTYGQTYGQAIRAKELWEKCDNGSPSLLLWSCSLSCCSSNSMLHASILVRTVHKPRTTKPLKGSQLSHAFIFVSGITCYISPILKLTFRSLVRLLQQGCRPLSLESRWLVNHIQDVTR